MGAGGQNAPSAGLVLRAPVAQLQGDVLDDVATPVTTILEEIELVQVAAAETVDYVKVPARSPSDRT